jgi:16S rRNA (uracil1498-N3)-methyltransferase
MPSFLVHPDDIVADRLTLRGDEAHHVTVRRYSVGDFVEVVDGQGGFYRVRIDRIERTSVHGLIMDREPERGESPVRLHLAAAVMKGSHRFDHVVEKATEVGVASIRPMMAERGVATGNRSQRWQRLAREAAKQCGRSRVPRVGEPRDFEDALAALLRDCGTVVMASVPRGKAHPEWEFLNADDASVGLMTGPEGGFSGTEEAAAVASGVQPFSWGERTLRADTACVALSALVLERAARHIRVTGQ